VRGKACKKGIFEIEDRNLELKNPFFITPWEHVHSGGFWSVQSRLDIIV